MNILVCNDDGVFSEGIFTLALMLSQKNNRVIVVAPDGNRSAFSHSLTIHKDIQFKKVFLSEQFQAYSLSGTPADCVKFAIHYFKDIKFDVVCSGINVGPNLGTDVVYSGTISCGLEANALGYKSMAFSCTDFKNINYDTAKRVCSEIFDSYFKYLDDTFTLNVNFPNVDYEKLQGVKVTKIGVQLYSDSYINTSENNYMLVGEPIGYDKNDPDCDVEWNLKNYVTVTPIIYDKTHYGVIERIRKTK